MIADRMGSLPASELDSVQDRLRAILGLAAMADTNVAEASR
jgi:hypothetical protein